MKLSEIGDFCFASPENLAKTTDFCQQLRGLEV
jgi:hypothetical protein